MKPKIKIELLKKYPELIIDAATLWYNNLGYLNPEHSLLSAIEITKKGITGKNEKWSVTVIALDNKKVVGQAVLLEHFTELHVSLKPVLVGLCVDLNYRNQGIGKQLIESIEEQAHFLHFKKLYLFVTNKTLPQWYKKLGWHDSLVHCNFNGKLAIIMEKNISI